MTVVHQPDLVARELVELTRQLGRPEKDLVILAEGNTSMLLDDGRLVVKASGSNMASATVDDFVTVEVAPLVALMDDVSATQTDLTAALDAGVVDGRRRWGSIETLVHIAVQAVAPAAFVAHTHPTAVVGMLASVHAETAWSEWVYSDEAVVIGRPLYVPYATPGIDLGRSFLSALRQRMDQTGDMPQLVLLGNHGIIAIAPTPSGVEGISDMAVKGARVRSVAYSVGGVAPIPAASIQEFFDREDIIQRRGDLSQGRF